MWWYDGQVLDDVAPAAWLLPRMGGRFGAVTRTVPGGFDSYARILHPAVDASGDSITWAAVARATGRQVHPTAQWHAVTDAADPINPGPTSRWQYYTPEKGALAAEQVGALCGVLAKHTATPLDCFACCWEGWAGLHPPRPTVQKDWRFRLSAPPEPADGVLSPEEVASPFVEHPGRRYRLYAGPLPEPRQFSLVNLAFPPHTASPFLEQPPSIFWPADHSWCFASEIDFNSTLVGGTTAMIDDVLAHPDLEAWSIEPADSLAIDGDGVNPSRQQAPARRRRSWLRRPRR